MFQSLMGQEATKMRLSPLSLYGLVLLSAVAHAAWNALLKRAGERPADDGGDTAGRSDITAWLFFRCTQASAVTWMWLAFATVAVFAYYGLLIQSYRSAT